MLKYLTSMSLAELLTTLAAWGGLVLGIMSFWKENLTRLSVELQVEVRNTAYGTLLYDEEVVKNTSLTVCSWIREDSSLAFKITNLSQFPIYVDSFGFCKPWYKDWKVTGETVKFADVSVILSCCTETSASVQGTLQVPFCLKPLEAVSIKLNTPHLNRETINLIKNTNCVCVFAKTTNKHVDRHSCQKFFDALLNRINLP